MNSPRSLLQRASVLLAQFINHCGDVCPDSSRFSDEDGLSDLAWDLKVDIAQHLDETAASTCTMAGPEDHVYMQIPGMHRGNPKESPSGIDERREFELAWDLNIPLIPLTAEDMSPELQRQVEAYLEEVRTGATEYRGFSMSSQTKVDLDAEEPSENND